MTAEYFDNQLSKWVWVDPQIHAYATHKNVPLSHNELAQMYVQGKSPKIQFSSRTIEYLEGHGSALKILRNFIKRYVWISRVGGFNTFYTDQSSAIQIGCKRAGVLPSITFQGFADKMAIFLPQSMFDAPVNSCQMRIETLAPEKLIELKTLEDYRKMAHKNFAKSQIKIVLNHSMPWFSHYDVIINKRRVKLKKDSLSLRLKNGANEIAVRPVNSFGRAGLSCKATLRFDNRYKAVKNYW